MGGTVVMYSNELRTTQQGSNYVDYNRSYHPGLEARLLTEDFCNCMYLSLRASREDDSFYYIKDKNLKDLIGFYYETSEHDFDEIICQCIFDLIIHGKAYIEQVLFFDKDNKLAKIQFVPVRAKRHMKIFGTLYYYLKRYDKKWIFGHINCNNLIDLNLKDIGYPKHYFKSIFKKLDKLERRDLKSKKFDTDKKSGFDFDLFRRKQDLKKLKVLKNLKWSDRGNNQFITEPYLVYREMQFDLLQEQILKYVIKQINESLKQTGDKYGFSGKIQYDSKTKTYATLLEQLRTGEKNCEQVSKVVFSV